MCDRLVTVKLRGTLVVGVTCNSKGEGTLVVSVTCNIKGEGYFGG